MTSHTNRRQFIARAATGTVALALPRWGRATTAPRVAVVGAGLSGLSAATQLAAAGANVTVYEARSRVGGRVQSSRTNSGFILDQGGAFINSEHVDMQALAQRTGVTLFDRTANKTGSVPCEGYVFDGSVRSEAELADSLRAIAGQIADDYALIFGRDGNFDKYLPIFDAISVSAYLDKNENKLPTSLARTILENAIRTEYGVEPEESSAVQLLFLLPEVTGETVVILGSSDERFVVQQGAQAIPRRLANALGGRVKRYAELRSLTRKSGGGYRLEFSGPFGVSWSTRADFVVVTLPFPVLRDIELEAPLSPLLRRMIAETGLGRNEKLLAEFDTRAWEQAAGFETDVWTDLGFASGWVGTQRQSGSRSGGFLTLFHGGLEVGALALGSADAQGARAISEFERKIPGLSAASTGTFFRTRWNREKFSRGAYATYRPGQLTEFAELFWIEGEQTVEATTGDLFLTGEHLSDAFYGFMEGAAETGRLAAQEIIRRA